MLNILVIMHNLLIFDISLFRNQKHIIMETSEKQMFVIFAIKDCFKCGGEFVEKWLDKNNSKLRWEDITDNDSAIREIERISKSALKK